MEVIIRGMSLQSLASTALNGADWMICNLIVEIIVQSSMAIKFIILAEMPEMSKSKFSFFKSRDFSERIVSFSFRYTEIWSDDEGSKNIKLAYPILNNYNHYPELVLVDVNFCVKT